MTNSRITGGPKRSAYPIVRRIRPADLKDALAKGLADYLAVPPSSLIFMSLIYPLYPIIGIIFTENALELSWKHLFDLRHAPSFPSMLALGLVLLALFISWVLTAEWLYVWLFGPAPPESTGAFLDEVFTTSRGWALIVLGNATGFVFAVVALSISVVSFPLLLERNVGVAVAVRTSFRAVLASPFAMALWGLIVAVSLAIGCLLILIGLAFVVPILAHATWHLYRRVVA